MWLLLYREFGLPLANGKPSSNSRMASNLGKL